MLTTDALVPLVVGSVVLNGRCKWCCGVFFVYSTSGGGTVEVGRFGGRVRSETHFPKH